MTIQKFKPNGICSNKAQGALSGGVSAILRPGLILENIRRLFAVGLIYLDNVHEF